MWQYPISIISYLVVAAIVVWLSIKLSDYVDLLDKKTKISGAFLGGILLAAVTSLPELFTSLTSTIFIHENNYVVGNILGSDLFNVCLFFIIYIFFFKKFITSKVSKSYLISLIFLGVLYVTVTLAVFVFNANHLLFGLFNPMSLVIFVIYAVSLWKTPKVEETPEEEKVMESKLTVKQIVILFIIFSILLISASVGVTYLTDWVVQVYNIPGKTFSGALFLGVATSLPELTSTINLSKKKNFDAAFGNIIGSNVFNFLILFIADIFTFIPGKPLYQSEGISTLLLIIFGSISVILMIVSLLIKDKISKHIKAARVYYTVIGTLYVGMYITFLILSNL